MTSSSQNLHIGNQSVINAPIAVGSGATASQTTLTHSGINMDGANQQYAQLENMLLQIKQGILATSEFPEAAKAKGNAAVSALLEVQQELPHRKPEETKNKAAAALETLKTLSMFLVGSSKLALAIKDLSPLVMGFFT